MTSTHDDTAAVPPQKPRRTASRIVPAIPHRFSKRPAPRPVTPEKTATAEAPASESVAPTEDDGAAKQHAEGDRKATPIPAQQIRDPSEPAIGTLSQNEQDLADSPARSNDVVIEDAALDHGQYVHICFLQCLTCVAAANGSPEPRSTPVLEGSDGQLEPDAPKINGHSHKPSVSSDLQSESHPQAKPASESQGDRHEESPSSPLPVNGTSQHAQASLDGPAPENMVQEPAIASAARSASQTQEQPFARPPPGLAPPPLAPQFFPGHSHHPSASTHSWPQAYAMAPPFEPGYTNGNDYQSPTHPPTMSSFSTIPFSPFTPSSDVPHATNGSTTPSPNKTQFEDPNVAAMYDPLQQGAHFANGSMSHAFENGHEGYDMAQHVFHLLGNPEFTDFILHVRTKDTILLSLPVHAAIVSRSPVIMAGLRRSVAPAYRKDSRRLVDVLTTDKFITSESLHEGVKILYAAPLLSAQSFLFGLLPYDGVNLHDYVTHEARRRMSQALSYTAAGRVFQIAEMQNCGLRIAKALLRWDTIDQALHFGHSAGLTHVQPSVAAADSRAFESYAAPLLDEAVEFLAYSFPPDFSLYALAPEMRQFPRLPTFSEAKTPAHNPRLSKIRFGDAPPEEDNKPSSVAQILSTVLLSLPLPLLDRLLGHPAAANRVGWSGLVKIMQDVVEEREARRQKTLAAYLSSGKEKSLPRALADNLHRTEKVQPTTDRPSGYMLTSSR